MQLQIKKAMMNLVALLVMAALFIGFLWVHVFFFSNYFDQFSGLPDVNGDGAFTIMDLPGVLFGASTEIGQQCEALLAQTPVGLFLEMSPDGSGWFWRILLTVLFGYFLPIAWYRMVLDWLNGSR